MRHVAGRAARRIRRAMLGLALASMAAATPAAAQPAPAIVPPDLLAVELPAGKTTLNPADPPLHALLAAASSGQRQVSNDVHGPLGEGATRVTWTAWDGAPGSSKPVATKAATVFVLPAGTTPVGVSGDENATAGNNATHIARDDAGRLHMIWADSGRPGGPAGPMYRRATVAPDGSVLFETPPFSVAGTAPSGWNAYPALAVTGSTAYCVWQGGGTAWVRRVSLGPSGYVWGPPQNTGAASAGRDIGPAILADGSNVRLVTPSGMFAMSADGGSTWKTEAIPVPPGQRMKAVSLAPAPSGATMVAFTSVVRDPGPHAAPGQGAGGYWQLRTVLRKADGSWTDAGNVLAAVPAWNVQSATTDSLADWVDIAAGPTGAMHLAWHGTALSHIYEHDEAYYAYRPLGGAWQAPSLLLAHAFAAGVKSFAPSLTIDGDRALVTVFFDVFQGTNWGGFDASVVGFRDGVALGPPLPLVHFVSDSLAHGTPAFALSSRFPAAAPVTYRAPDGTVWLDLLETLVPMGVGDAAKLVVLQRVDVTRLSPTQ